MTRHYTAKPTMVQAAPKDWNGLPGYDVQRDGAPESAWVERAAFEAMVIDLGDIAHLPMPVRYLHLERAHADLRIGEAQAALTSPFTGTAERELLEQQILAMTTTREILQQRIDLRTPTPTTDDKGIPSA